MEKQAFELFEEIMKAMDVAYDLMYEYDSLPHQYGDSVLYQAESHLIQLIGKQQGITTTELSRAMNKTSSACSQLIKKLREKKWVYQVRNEENNREYNLHLTEEGKHIFENHEAFDKLCYEHKFGELSKFTKEELQTYLEVQNLINKTFKEDVAHSYTYFSGK